MIKIENITNIPNWELEITCPNRNFRDEVVLAILDQGFINFEVETVDCHSNHEGWEGTYTILMWGPWMNNLHCLTKELKKIEKRLNI